MGLGDLKLQVNYLGSTMFRLSLLLVIGLTAYVHATDFTCETPTPCEKVPGAVECSADCSCTDNVADQCSRPHPTTAVHVDTIEDCMANCKVFALEDRCKFIIFHYDNIDENCIIMNDEMDAYTGHCNIRGQALWSPTPKTGLGVWGGCNGDDCVNDANGNCNACTDCSTDPCRGFMLSACTYYSLPKETLESMASWEQCENLARTNKPMTAVLYHREEQACELYGGAYDEWAPKPEGNMSPCTAAFVKLGVDTQVCSP